MFELLRLEPFEGAELLEKPKKLYSLHLKKMFENHKRNLATDFSGKSADLSVLDFCEYEIGHPDTTYKSAALLWANVIEANTDLVWGRNQTNDVFLFSNSRDGIRFSLSIESTVLGFIEAQVSASESFMFLTEKIMIDMIINGYQAAELSKLKAVYREAYPDQSDCYRSRVLYAILELYGVPCDDADVILEKTGVQLPLC